MCAGAAIITYDSQDAAKAAVMNMDKAFPFEASPTCVSALLALCGARHCCTHSGN